MEEKEKLCVYYKSTIWTELKFECTPEQKKQILEVLENFGLDYIIDDTLGFEESETLFDTEEFMNPDENNGNSTVNVHDGNSKLIWDNVNNKL